MNYKIMGVAVTLSFLTGCSAYGGSGPVEVTSKRSPVDSHQEIIHQPQGNIIGVYHHRTPTDPGEWKTLNNEQANPLGGGS